MGWGTKARARPFLSMLQATTIVLPLGGCLLTGSTPEPGRDIPAADDGASKNPAVAEAALPPLDWWRSFRARELTEIVEAARASNLDIAVAIARIVQADAQARITGAALLPIIDLNGTAQHSQQSKTTGSSRIINVSRSGPTVAIINNNLTATLNASYEIDFWGKNRSALRAAEELAVATRYDREVVALTTVVSV